MSQVLSGGNSALIWLKNGDPGENAGMASLGACSTMAEQLTKLRPDRDLQCYFQQPSAVAALSDTSAIGFKVSGSWRQAFDWAVVEWNRDNVFEHPALRNLPDGDLSGLVLSYEETRTNCVAIDSTVYDAIGWSCLRIWEESNGAENFHKVALRAHATPVAGEMGQAEATLELQGTPTPGDLVEVAWLDQHTNWLVTSNDTLETIVGGLAGFINGNPGGNLAAVADGTLLKLTYLGLPGANGNRVGVYTGVCGAKTEVWSPSSTLFTGGESPTRWRVDLDFGNLTDTEGQHVTTTNVRRVRWTWAADLQSADFERTGFEVAVSNWSVTGTRLEYKVAGPGSRRIEDDGRFVSYSGHWMDEERGNYSGGSIRKTTTRNASVTCEYGATDEHSLYLGTRITGQAAAIEARVDGGAPIPINLKRALEDRLVRVPLGQYGAADRHVVTITHNGSDGELLFFDFLEIAAPTSDLPSFEETPLTTLATDWDTDHSLAIAPERTAWLIHKLGFRGRANHYVGAMWWHEMVNPENRYATGAVQFAGAPDFGAQTSVTISGVTLWHMNYLTDTAESVAKAFELLINAGSSAVWARAEGSTLHITARALGAEGNSITIDAETGSTVFTGTRSGPTLAGGIDGAWLTDVAATPRINPAAGNWSRSYVRALRLYGIETAAAFSMELRHGDARPAAAIAQRYPDGPCILNTPALQTNFGPQSTAFWRQVYRDMADVMVEAGAVPYLQFGEAQWWYFANATGMPFYDAYTMSMFEASYGRAMRIIDSEYADPAAYGEEAQFLPTLIGQFTAAVIAYVRATHPTCRFEVLYPPDTNDTPIGRAVNFPAEQWTPQMLACLKTENFTFTGSRNLDKARMSLQMPAERGFPARQRSHLIGIGEYTTPWEREWSLAIAQGVESVVLFALDQFCLIGYSAPIGRGTGRSAFMGSA